MEDLGLLDAGFIEAEEADPHVSMAIASIGIFEGPPPTYDEFASLIRERLPLVRRYRQKVKTIPFRIGPPVWVDDPHFDLRFHIRQTAVPPPGGDAELAQLMARVMAQRLDRDRPLWEDWLVTGLADDHWALISKVHHCMVDGVSGTDLYRVIFDPAPDEKASADETPSREPSAAALMVHATGAAVARPARTARAAMSSLAHPMGTLTDAARTARAMWEVSRAVPPAGRSSLSGPIHQQRRYTWVRAELEDLKSIKRELGGTVNDVALAAITAGFRALLISRGETPGDHTVPSLVPVSLRAPGEEHLQDNRVSAMIINLPVHLPTAEEQLSAVRERLTGLKAASEFRAGVAAVSLAAHLPYPVVSLVRWGFKAPQREIVTVTTNVPGPRQTLYCLGRALVEIIPYVPIASTLRIGVSIFSYRDQMIFGLTGDYDSTPDLEVLAQGIRHGVADLMKAGRSAS